MSIPEESAESTNYKRSTEEESFSPGMELIRNCREAHIQVEVGLSKDKYPFLPTKSASMQMKEPHGPGGAFKIKLEHTEEAKAQSPEVRFK